MTEMQFFLKVLSEGTYCSDISWRLLREAISESQRRFFEQESSKQAANEAYQKGLNKQPL